MTKKKYFSQKNVQDLERFTKANLINSISGFKSANLIGTKNKNGDTNLAVFNSVCHLGSAPTMIHFTLRPHTVARHTYENILENSYFTINAVTKDTIEQAHQTSAKYNAETSEFEATGLVEEYHNDFFAPYVRLSPIQLGCKYINTYEIKENGCLLVVAAIEDIYINEELIADDGFVNLDEGGIASIVGLDGYYKPEKLARFPFARP